MRFLADMGVSMRIVEWLRTRGHDAIHLREERLQRLPNGQIFAKAVAEGRIVITFDLDFAEIAALTRGERAGVVVFRLRNTRTPHVVERLATALGIYGDSVVTGGVLVIEESRCRFRRLPVGERTH